MKEWIESQCLILDEFYIIQIPEINKVELHKPVIVMKWREEFKYIKLLLILVCDFKAAAIVHFQYYFIFVKFPINRDCRKPHT